MQLICSDFYFFILSFDFLIFLFSIWKGFLQVLFVLFKRDIIAWCLKKFWLYTVVLWRKLNIFCLERWKLLLKPLNCLFVLSKLLFADQYWLNILKNWESFLWKSSRLRVCTFSLVNPEIHSTLIFMSKLTISIIHILDFLLKLFHLFF